MNFDIISFLAGGLIFGLIIYIIVAHKATVKDIKISALETQINQEKENAIIFENTKNELANTFKSLSLDIASKTTQDFLSLAKSQLEQINTNAKQDLEKRQDLIQKDLAPVKDLLNQVNTQLNILKDSEKELKNQTANLVSALKESHTRGRWGEIQLKRVVELAGMQNYCDFEEQKTFDTEGNSVIRPDMIINLPSNRKIIVDAKTPLDGYLRYIDATTETDKLQFLIKHAEQIKEHIRKLSEKKYTESVIKNAESLDFVVLFIPGEQFLSAALSQDPTLIEFGFEKKVILATPTSLIALLKAVYYGWQQNLLAENAKEISALGKELYERMNIFATHFSDVGNSLNSAVRNYNETVSSLESRVLPSARKFRDLHIESEKNIKTIDQLEHNAKEISAIELIKEK